MLQLLLSQSPVTLAAGLLLLLVLLNVLIWRCNSDVLRAIYDAPEQFSLTKEDEPPARRRRAAHAAEE